MQEFHIKKPILSLLTFVTALVIAAFLYTIYHEEQEHLARDMSLSVKAVEGYYHAALEERAHKLETALMAIAIDPELQSSFAAHDRNALLAKALPIFQQLKNKHNITHFYFHDAQRSNFLRVHQPSRYGDSIDRFTTFGAMKTKALFKGVELGPLGTFTLRAVFPLWQGKELLGYIELGEDLDQIIQEMIRAFDLNIAVVIDKQYLRRSDWITGMRMLGHKVAWNKFPYIVATSQSLNTLPEELNDILSLPLAALPADDINVAKDGQQYYGRILPLYDAGEKNIGSMVMLRNVTAHVRSGWYMVALVTASILAIGVLLFLLSIIVVRQSKSQMNASLSKLQSTTARLENGHRIAHLGTWEWDLKSDEVRLSENMVNILEINKGQYPSQYIELVGFIHPDDREDFQRFMNIVRDNGKTYELIHRILRKDGTERTVRHHADVVCDMSGNSISINATILDITEWQHATIRSVHMNQILKHSWDEIYTFDANTLKFLEVSDGACRNLGYTLEELQKMTPLDIKPEYNRDQFEALLEPLRIGEENHLKFETKHRRKDGSEYPVEVRLQLSPEKVAPVFVAIIQDVSERNHYIEELEYKALHDTLTGLPNRSLLLNRLQYMIEVARRETSTLAVFIVDVVRLREINDLLGHQNGDLALKEIAQRLQEGLRNSDTVSRLGGDEFVVVTKDVDTRKVHHIAKKIQLLFESPIFIEESPLELESVIGIALYPEHGDDPGILLQHADIAMRVAKGEASGPNIYNSDDDPFSVRRLKLHGELRKAINNKSLAVYYQPKVDISSGKVISVEALSRWPHPKEGMIPPNDFIPMVEQSGLIRPFTHWVLDEAIKQSKLWIKEGIDLTVSVNLSARNLHDPNLIFSINKLLKSQQVDPDRIILEITESAVMSRPESALKVLTELHAMGLKISIDDFGTGYSSLAYLKKLPVNELKIDYSFVSNILNNDSDAVIVRSTIDLAHNLGMGVVAEGVENKDILDLLDFLHCDIAQGYYFSRPIPPEEFSFWLKKSTWPYVEVTPYMESKFEKGSKHDCG